MIEPLASAPCPCESGLSYGQCCQANARVRSLIHANGNVEGEALTLPAKAAFDTLSSSPDLFPAVIDYAQGRMRLIKMSPTWYRDSVFLDTGRIRGRYVIDASLDALAPYLAAGKRQPAAFIFHTAFCGSTLLSQLLDTAYTSLPLREPDALGNLMMYLRAPQVDAQRKNAAYDSVMRLLARRYQAAETALIKANDYCNPMMQEILHREPDTPQLFMYVPLSEFVAACLRVPARREWIRQRYRAVRQPAGQFLADAPADLSADDVFAPMAAFYWAYNIALYRRAQGSGAAPFRCLDFNTLLTQPLSAAVACARHFGLAPRERVDLEQTVQRLFGVYSKNGAYTYSPGQRQRDIYELHKVYAAEIEAAQVFAQRLLGDDYPHEPLPGALV